MEDDFEVLTADALLTTKSAKTDEPVNEIQERQKRRRRTKAEMEAERNEGRIVPPKAASQPRSNSDKDDKKEKRSKEEKKKRADDLTKKITEEFNESVLEILMTIGMPAEMLYKEGHIPAHAPSNSIYTPIGDKLTIGKDQAYYMSRFFTELEDTNIGKKFSGVAGGDSKLPMIFYGAMAGVSMLQWAKGLQEVMTEIKKLQELQQRASAIDVDGGPIDGE